MIKGIKSNFKELMQIIKFTDRWKKFLALSFAGFVFEGIDIQILTLGRRLVIDAILKQDIKYFIIGLAALMVFSVFSCASIITIDYLIYKMAIKIIYDSKERIVKCLFKRKQNIKHDINSADMIYRINNDVQNVSEIYGLLYLCIACLGRTIGAVIAGMSISWILSIVVIGMGILNLFLQKLKVKPLSELSAKVKKLEAEYLNSLYEILKNHMFIKVMANRERFFRYKLQINKEYNEANLKEGKINGKIYTYNSGFFMISILLIIGIGSYMVLTNKITVGGLTAFIGLQGALMDPYGYFSDLIMQYGDIRASYKRINELTENEEEDYKISDTLIPDIELSTGMYNIELKHITFSYNKQQDIFRDLSLRIPSGQTVYITGSSGAGKTTLFKILMGIEKPLRGNVALNINNRIEALPIKQMTYVSQNPFLFNGTIYENITLNANINDLENVIRAAKKAGIHEFIMSLKDGYQTILQDDGKTISGGQRTRISLARAFYRQSPILLLDEIFSSLDKTTAEDIRRAIENDIQPNHCVLIITHRDDLIPQNDLRVNIS